MKEIAIVSYQGSLRTNNKHLKSGASFITDAPTDNHGKGEAFSPTDLLATSLANCIITIMGIAAEAMSVSFESIEARVHKEMNVAPRRVGTIRVELNLQSSATAEEREQLEQRGRNCPVALSLHPDLQQEVTFNWR